MITFLSSLQAGRSMSSLSEVMASLTRRTLLRMQCLLNAATGLDRDQTFFYLSVLPVGDVRR
jgi:hypothetical protein